MPATLTATLTRTVNAGPATSLVFSAPASATFGTMFTGTVTAKDTYGNTVKDYTGTVHFTASGSGATRPADYTFSASDAGVKQFDFTLRTAGSNTLTVMDSAAGLSATASVTVTSRPAAKLVLTAPAGPFTAGVTFSVDVEAQDAAGDVVTDYTGTVHFSSSDPLAGLPADATFTAGDAGHDLLDIGEIFIQLVSLFSHFHEALVWLVWF